MIFVSDASAELSAPEVAFLAEARERCPIVIQALTKVDLYSEWRRIADLDRAHLAKAGIDAQTIPLSAVLRAAGLETLDPDLTRRSGYPELFSALRGGVIGPARQNAADRAIAESTAALDLLEATAREELAVLEDPSRLAEVLGRSEAARARLDHLKGPGSKWSTLVADRVSDLSNEANYRFKGSMRDVMREMDEYTEVLKTPSDWDAAAARLQERVATAVSDVFLELDRGTETIRAAVMDLLAEEDLSLPATSRGPGVDVRALWRDQTISLAGTKAGRLAGTALVGLRGAQSGMMMFGTITRLAPAGVAAVMLSNPVTIGLGAAFAGMQLLDAHRRRLNALRAAGEDAHPPVPRRRAVRGRQHDRAVGARDPARPARRFHRGDRRARADVRGHGYPGAAGGRGGQVAGRRAIGRAACAARPARRRARGPRGEPG